MVLFFNEKYRYVMNQMEISDDSIVDDIVIYWVRRLICFGGKPGGKMMERGHVVWS